MDGRQIGVEIHLESNSVAQLAGTIKPLESKIKPIFPQARVVWDPNWSEKRGRLRVLFNQDIDAEEIAEALIKLINNTKDEISNELKNLTIK